jgi:hypothetical protein
MTGVFSATQSVHEFLLLQIYPSKAEMVLWHIFRLFFLFYANNLQQRHVIIKVTSAYGRNHLH